MKDNLWVLAYDGEGGNTREPAGFVSCPAANAAFHKARLELEGLRVVVLTSEEVDELLANRGVASRRCAARTRDFCESSRGVWAGEKNGAARLPADI